MVVDTAHCLLYSASTAPTPSASSGHLATGNRVRPRPVVLYTVFHSNFTSSCLFIFVSLDSNKEKSLSVLVAQCTFKKPVFENARVYL